MHPTANRLQFFIFLLGCLCVGAGRGASETVYFYHNETAKWNVWFVGLVHIRWSYWTRPELKQKCFVDCCSPIEFTVHEPNSACTWPVFPFRLNDWMNIDLVFDWSALMLIIFAIGFLSFSLSLSFALRHQTNNNNTE